MSYFNYERIAEGYAKDRPLYHMQVMDMLKEEFALYEKMENGLDVGCGAGSSALALQKVCKNVTAVDESEEMIKTAKRNCKDSGIEFIQCRAEELNLPEDKFDIITAAGSVNWIDEHIFLKHVNRLLKKNGILLIYDDPMIDQMEGVPEFTDWWNNEYLKHFPKPPRKETVWDKSLVERYGLQVVNQVTYRNSMIMSQEEFVRYIITQTNVIAKIEQQGEDLETARQWFERSVAHIFDGKKQALVCEGYNWYFQKK